MGEKCERGRIQHVQASTQMHTYPHVLFGQSEQPSNVHGQPRGRLRFPHSDHLQPFSACREVGMLSRRRLSLL